MKSIAFTLELFIFLYQNFSLFLLQPAYILIQLHIFPFKTLHLILQHGYLHFVVLFLIKHTLNLLL